MESLKQFPKIPMFPQGTVWTSNNVNFSQPVFQTHQSHPSLGIREQERTSKYPELSGKNSTSETTNCLLDASSTFSSKSQSPSDTWVAMHLLYKEPTLRSSPCSWWCPVMNDVHVGALLGLQEYSFRVRLAPLAGTFLSFPFSLLPACNMGCFKWP